MSYVLNHMVIRSFRKTKLQLWLADGKRPKVILPGQIIKYRQIQVEGSAEAIAQLSSLLGLRDHVGE